MTINATLLFLVGFDTGLAALSVEVAPGDSGFFSSSFSLGKLFVMRTLHTA